MTIRPTIAYVTDFGHDSPYVAQMKCVALSINPDVQFLDVTHSISPQDIRHGAFVLNQIADFLPPGSCLVAIVDPGVGSDRTIIAAEWDGIFFVGPNNGIFSELIDRKGVEKLVNVVEPSYWRDEVSSTFHGRDIMTPVATHLLSGVPIDQLGPSTQDIESLHLAKPTAKAGTITGEIVYVDSFGNVVTNISREFFFEHVAEECRATATVKAGPIQVGKILRTYSDAQNGTVVSLFGSTDLLEIAKVGGNIADEGRLAVGDSVNVDWVS